MEPVNTILHQNFPWLPDTGSFELPRFYRTREEAIQAQEERSSKNVPAEIKSQTQTVSQEEWALRLVNAENPIPSDFCPELETIYTGSPYQVDTRIAEDLRAMLEDAQRDGVDLLICSAYRSYEQQARNLQQSVNRYRRTGYSPDQAMTMAGRYVAQAGESEHQTGLAVDIVTPDYQVLDDGYANTAAAKWLEENAARYGFILRYPQNKSEITGIWYEPWHYRYVGKQAACIIMEQEICLEEYLEQREKQAEHHS